MILKIGDQTYDTDQLLSFDTGAPDIPSLFITPDFTCVFVLTMNRWRGAEVHQADRLELRQLAQRFPHIQAIQTALAKASAT